MKTDNSNYSNPPCEKGEIWKDVVGYEPFYMVSNYGKVWSKPRLNRGRVFGGYFLSNHIDNRNRCLVSLSNGVKRRNLVPARLVLTAFIGKPKDYEEANHLDENPLNNRLDNLEWCSHIYNCNYGTRIDRIKEKQNMAVLQYTLKGEFLAEYASMHIAAEAINADAGHICDCCLGNRKWAYGYFWRYKDDSLYEQAKTRLSERIRQSKASRLFKWREKLGKAVKQYTKQGEFLQEYRSASDAAELTGICRANILMNCNGQLKSAGGYVWTH